jgi:hypothetical protein
MIIQLLKATISERGPSERQFLQCLLSVDGQLHRMDIGIVKKGNSKFLVLDVWEDLFPGQDEEFQKMRECLFLPLRGLPLPENAFIDLEDDATHDVNYLFPGFI